MKGLLATLGMTVGGWVGWMVGAPVSIFTAFITGMVGTGVGLYLTNQFVRRYLP